MHADALCQRFAADGFAQVADVIDPACCAELAARCADSGRPGTRSVRVQEQFGALLTRLRAHPALAALIPVGHVAVHCTMFEKSTGNNWLVPVHQDLGIPIAHRVAAEELTGWSLKDGQLYVQPPLAVLRELVAVRLHLDPCGEHDGALRVIAGSHRLGRIAADQAAQLRAQHAETVCTAAAGDALVMRPLLLHASSRASGNSRRRVLHFLFGPRELPCGLEWAEVG